MTDVSQPPTTELHALTATQAARLIRSREVSPVELVQHLLDRAASVDPQVQAWQTLDPEGALNAARAAEQAARTAHDAAPDLPLLGVPFGAKDIFDSAGLPTSASFAPYANRVPAVDSEPIARLKRAGGILLGKMVTTQFAQADPSKTRNPWADDHTPGGSSSGSAAGVSAQLVPLALGSQTAGSVLRPGGVQRRGRLQADTWAASASAASFRWRGALDHVGVLSRSVEDCELFLQVQADVTPRTGSVAAPRLGLVREAMRIASPRVREHLNAVARLFAAQDATIEEVSLGEPLDLILAVHHVIMQTEAASVHWQLLEQFPGAHSPRIQAYVEVGRLLPGVALSARAATSATDHGLDRTRCREGRCPAAADGRRRSARPRDDRRSVAAVAVLARRLSEPQFAEWVVRGSEAAAGDPAGGRAGT